MVVNIINFLEAIGNEFEVMNRFVKGNNILDVGFADKPNTKLHGNITGLDIVTAPKPLNYSQVVVGDAQRMPSKVGTGFDTILAGNLVEHLDNPASFLKECALRLKAGGILIISTDNPYRFPCMFGNVFFKNGMCGDNGHRNFFLPRMLNRMADKAGFKLLDIKCGLGLPFPFFQEKLVYVFEKSEELKRT